MSQELNEKAQPVESLIRDEAIEGALRYFLGAKCWRPSDLAKAAGVPVPVLHPIVMGYTPSIATLRHLCKSLEVDLWVFFMIGELLYEEDPAASLAAGIDRLRAAAEDILTSVEEGWLDERSM